MKIAYTGDLVLQDSELFDSEYVFSCFSNALEARECRELVINLESPITEGLNKVKDKICLNAVSDTVKHLKYLSPTLINLSNNHINDFGNKGVEQTIERISEIGFDSFGVGGIHDCKHVSIHNTHVNIAYTHHSADLSSPFLNATGKLLGPKPIDLEEIKKLKEDYSDKAIIVSVHWGIEDISIPCPEVVELARKIIDAGADIILGHHPHIIQPIEVYKGKYIFYSLGNFYFPDIKVKTDRSEFLKKTSKHQKVGLVVIISLDAILDVDLLMVSLSENKIKIEEVTASQFKFRPWKVKVFPFVYFADSKIKLYKYYLKRIKEKVVSLC
ncbi:CapA family protein [Vibrio sp. 1865]|uniref:CapA family protein n=1 Tax=unclassified Vibrio TaxID=2614977 RepID=UPI002963F8A1|nr:MULTISPECIES: CapA family protein [unclassified Vibrio]MDW2092043.1 CapA family protein [Vibrio sp. 1866]MDW3102130.1 CapA family protein [Vibrio sp. 1874]MDW3199802.1 CapA family protein [Vibrio sp. 1865]